MYTIDAILTIFPVPIPQLSGTIDQTGWEDAPYGTVTLTFYAEDLLGRIGSNSVDVEKIRPSQPIAGYHIVLLIGLVGITGIIFIYSLKKKLK